MAILTNGTKILSVGSKILTSGEGAPVSGGVPETPAGTSPLFVNTDDYILIDDGGTDHPAWTTN